MLKIPDGNFDAYIFDSDGTLALSMEIHYAAWRDAYIAHGATFDFTQELCQSMAGIGMIESVRILNQRFGHDMDPHAVLKTQEEFVHRHLHKVQPNPHVVEFALQVARTHPVAVASGGTRHTVHKTLDFLGLRDIFPVIVTSEDVEHQKPAPDIFLLAARRLGVTPGRCLVFEDSDLGIRGAQDAGMMWVKVEPQLRTQPATAGRIGEAPAH